MTPASSLTERYLDAALRGVPAKQRDDVARELRSSVADAVEDRVAAGEDPVAAETSVLEGLGDPTRFAAGISGRPLYLIGPDLFVEYRRLLALLLGIVVPIVGVVAAAVSLSEGGDWIGALVAGLVGALTVAVHLCFWVTLTFALIERADSARDARLEISKAAGRWTVDHLPAPESTRISAGEVVGEVLTTLLTIGAMFLLLGFSITGSSGESIPLLAPDIWSITIPILIAILASIAGVQVVVYLVGRWTMPLAIAFTVLEIAFAVPIIVLALTGQVINPAFAEEIGWPPLADGTGVVMLSIAAGVFLVTAYEIFDAWRRARRAAALDAVEA
jgi:uncharacterized membrane protein YiaA